MGDECEQGAQNEGDGDRGSDVKESRCQVGHLARRAEETRCRPGDFRRRGQDVRRYAPGGSAPGDGHDGEERQGDECLGARRGVARRPGRDHLHQPRSVCSQVSAATLGTFWIMDKDLPMFQAVATALAWASPNTAGTLEVRSNHQS